jgi:hypothetical protein
MVAHRWQARLRLSLPRDAPRHRLTRGARPAHANQELSKWKGDRVANFELDEELKLADRGW